MNHLGLKSEEQFNNQERCHINTSIIIILFFQSVAVVVNMSPWNKNTFLVLYALLTLEKPEIHGKNKPVFTHLYASLLTSCEPSSFIVDLTMDMVKCTLVNDSLPATINVVVHIQRTTELY